MGLRNKRRMLALRKEARREEIHLTLSHYKKKYSNSIEYYCFFMSCMILCFQTSPPMHVITRNYPWDLGSTNTSNVENMTCETRVEHVNLEALHFSFDDD